MTRPTCESLIVLLSAVGVLALLTAPQWGPVVDAWREEPAVAVVPFAEAMECPPWRQGLSRTVVVMATEDEAGRIVERRCVRTAERGKARVM